MGKMTQSNYELIAESIQRTATVIGFTEKNQVKRQAKFAALHLVACDLCGSLYGQNKKFDRDKFLKACGIDDEPYNPSVDIMDSET